MRARAQRNVRARSYRACIGARARTFSPRFHARVARIKIGNRIFSVKSGIPLTYTHTHTFAFAVRYRAIVRRCLLRNGAVNAVVFFRKSPGPLDADRRVRCASYRRAELKRRPFQRVPIKADFLRFLSGISVTVRAQSRQSTMVLLRDPATYAPRSPLARTAA